MGKASKLLHILVTDAALFHTPEAQTLVEQGHVVCLQVDRELYDMVLGPNCWRMPTSQVKHLPLAVRAGREQKYGRGEGV